MNREIHEIREPRKLSGEGDCMMAAKELKERKGFRMQFYSLNCNPSESRIGARIFSCKRQRTREKAFARRTRRWTQMKNSYSVSAIIGVICGQVRIRLRLAALVSLWQRDCQQEVLSRKNGASRKHHKIKQLQQIITAVRHQGKTKTVNISRFTFITFFTVFWAIWFNASCLENFKMALQTERQFGKVPIQVLCFVAK